MFLKNPSYSCQAIGHEYEKKKHIGLKILHSPKERHESSCRMVVYRRIKKKLIREAVIVQQVPK